MICENFIYHLAPGATTQAKSTEVDFEKQPAQAVNPPPWVVIPTLRGVVNPEGFCPCSQATAACTEEHDRCSKWRALAQRLPEGDITIARYE